MWLIFSILFLLMQFPLAFDSELTWERTITYGLFLSTGLIPSLMAAEIFYRWIGVV